MVYVRKFYTFNNVKYVWADPLRPYIKLSKYDKINYIGNGDLIEKSVGKERYIRNKNQPKRGKGEKCARWVSKEEYARMYPIGGIYKPKRTYKTPEEIQAKKAEYAAKAKIRRQQKKLTSKYLLPVSPYTGPVDELM